MRDYRKFAVNVVAAAIMSLLFATPGRCDDQDHHVPTPYQQEIHVGIPAGGGSLHSVRGQFPKSNQEKTNDNA